MCHYLTLCPLPNQPLTYTYVPVCFAVTKVVGLFTYTLYPDALSWTAAEAQCGSLGGHLASFGSVSDYTSVITAYAADFRSGPVAVGTIGEQVRLIQSSHSYLFETETRR